MYPPLKHEKKNTSWNLGAPRLPLSILPYPFPEITSVLNFMLVIPLIFFIILLPINIEALRIKLIDFSSFSFFEMKST